MRTRFHRTILATASLAVVGLLASGCSSQGPSATQSPTAEESAAGTTAPSSPAEPSPSAGESEPTEGVTFYDEPGGWREEDRQGRSPGEGEVRGSATAPNGESWPVDAVIDLAQLEAETSGEGPASSEADPVDCAQDWSDTQYLWLRDKTGWEAPSAAVLATIGTARRLGPPV